MTVDLRLLDTNDKHGRPLFMLIGTYRCELGPGLVVEVPSGYVTNFGTIPRWFYWVVSPSQLREAAIVHDWMCSEDLIDDDLKIESGYSRWLADAVLYEGMTRCGFGWTKRVLVWLGVRINAWTKALTEE